MKVHQNKRSRYRFWLAGLVIWLAIVGIYQTHKKIPDNLNYLGDEYIRFGETDVDFLYDLTYESSGGKIELDQSIFDAIFNLIENAERYILDRHVSLQFL